MPEQSNNPFNFWHELKRRKVVRVIIAYVVVGFAIIEFVDIVTEPLGLPEWALTLIIVLVAVGFPIAIIFAWIFDITAKGVKKTEPAYKGFKQIESEQIIKDALKYDNSVAVLPFQDMSPERDQEYFCDGIAEEIINALTKVKHLYIVARTSSFSFKGQNIDIREIGNKLGVATLLEGSVRKSGNKLRITVQLISVIDGYHIWSEQFDRATADIFNIQSEISKQIVNKLQISLLPEEIESLKPKQSTDIEAYSLYLKGRYYWNQLTEDGIKTGMDHFKMAIKHDPNYAPAYSGVADCYFRLGWYSYFPSKDVFPKAKEAAEKALKLDSSLSEAWCSIAFFNMCFNRNYKQAEKDFKKAIDLNPNHAQAHANYSILLSVIGKHEEAIIEGEKAVNLDPLTMMMHLNHGMRYFYKRQFTKTVEYIKRTLEMDPEFVMAHYYLTYASIQTKEFKTAQEEILTVFDNLGRNVPAFLIAYAIVLALSPERNDLNKVVDELHELSKTRYIPPFWLAMLYIVLKQYDEAFQWLNTAYNEHDCLLIFLNVDPLFDSVRSDPRYISMLKKINLN
jgi:TolB-like protein/Tfp pilus assembly protein PilF